MECLAPLWGLGCRPLGDDHDSKESCTNLHEVQVDADSGIIIVLSCIEQILVCGMVFLYCS